MTSCSGFTDEQHFYIHPALKPYYDSFVIEGKKRGVVVDPQSIILTIKPLSTCGLTVYSTNSVFIDTTSSCWGIDKRELVFHELGHFILHRSHDNEIINGKIKSIMIGDGYIVNMANDEKYYFDELFSK